VRNREAMMGLEVGYAFLAKPLMRLLHALNRNSLQGSKKNIAAHYDLGNDFFESFLDETMMYSAGIFESEDATMYDASIAKNDRICRKLHLSEKDHVLEIGTGWGGFAMHAAKHYGCRVTTTTISENQYTLAKKRVAEAGLAEKITVLKEDYRKLSGTYHKIVSIEMIEAVGWQYYREFFRTCSRLLKRDGSMLIQAITIQDQYFEFAKRNVDFIQKYIFPGCTIPSATALLSAATGASDLKLFHHEDNTPHYERTLHEWRHKLHQNAEQILGFGYTAELLRLWDFYFCYCIGGFAERNIHSVQMTFTKPFSRLAPIPAKV